MSWEVSGAPYCSNSNGTKSDILHVCIRERNCNQIVKGENDVVECSSHGAKQFTVSASLKQERKKNLTRTGLEPARTCVHYDLNVAP
jgi:hypothetical protein